MTFPFRRYPGPASGHKGEMQLWLFGDQYLSGSRHTPCRAEWWDKGDSRTMDSVSSGLFVNHPRSWEFTSHLASGQHLPGRLSWNWNSGFLTSREKSGRRAKYVWQFESWDIRMGSEVSDLKVAKQGELTTSTWEIFRNKNLFRNNRTILESPSHRGTFISPRIIKSPTFSTITRPPLNTQKRSDSRNLPKTNTCRDPDTHMPCFPSWTGPFPNRRSRNSLPLAIPISCSLSKSSALGKWFSLVLKSKPAPNLIKV
jgi:hypothetical protein